MSKKRIGRVSLVLGGSGLEVGLVADIVDRDQGSNRLDAGGQVEAV